MGDDESPILFIPMESKLENLPRHVAIIMDGNGRWAERLHLSRAQGHIEGVKRVEEIIDVAGAMGIEAITLFTFSTENWNRPETEVSMLMSTLSAAFDRKIEKLKRDNIQFRMIGRKERIPKSLLQTMDKVVEETKDNTGLIMNLAFNYGSRLEITDAVKDIARRVQDGSLKIEDIEEDTISNSLYTKELMDPDLLIRTSGEKRISNFLLWQLSYAEFYFIDKLWPEFTGEEFQKAIMEYQQRERRFGNL